MRAELTHILPSPALAGYHAKQMLEGDVASADLKAVVEPWFLGPGADSPPGETFKAWADEMESKYGTKFTKDLSDLEISVSPTPSRHSQREP